MVQWLPFCRATNFFETAVRVAWTTLSCSFERWCLHATWLFKETVLADCILPEEAFVVDSVLYDAHPSWHCRVLAIAKHNATRLLCEGRLPVMKTSALQFCQRRAHITFPAHMRRGLSSARPFLGVRMPFVANVVSCFWNDCSDSWVTVVYIIRFERWCCKRFLTRSFELRCSDVEDINRMQPLLLSQYCDGGKGV